METHRLSGKLGEVGMAEREIDRVQENLDAIAENLTCEAENHGQVAHPGECALAPPWILSSPNVDFHHWEM
jgi:hypothetical protein